MAAGTATAAALPALARLRTCTDGLASVSVIVCAASYVIDVVVVAFIFVLQFFAAHCSSSAPVPSVLNPDSAVCASPRALFVSRVRRLFAVAFAPTSLANHLRRQEVDLLSNTEEHFCIFCIQGRHVIEGTGHP